MADANSRDQLYTAAQAAAELGVPASVIRQWRRAAKVMPAGMLRAPVPGGMQPLYRLAELEPLAKRYRARHARKRPLPPQSS